MIPSDWMPPPVATGNPAYPVKMLTRLCEKAEDQRLARIATRKDMAPKYFAWMLQSLSIQSKVIVTKHLDNSTSSLAQNPKSLFLIIRETHLTNVSGVGTTVMQKIGRSRSTYLDILKLCQSATSIRNTETSGPCYEYRRSDRGERSGEVLEEAG